MQHEIENSNQTDVEATVRAFIETDLTRELQALRLSFRQPLRDWFTDTRDAILRLKKDDERHYQQTIDLLSDKLPELRTIIESIESESWYSKFESSITQVATSLPEVIQENQTDAHLNSAKSDSIYVKTGKFIKRIKQKVGGKPLRRTVYVRQLFLQHVTSSEEWIKDFAAREYDEYAMLLDLLLEKSDDQPETQENEDSEKKNRKTDFKFQIFSELEEHLHVAVQHLKQVEQNNEEHVKKLIETFATDLITKCHAAGTFQLPQKKLSAEIQTRLPEEPFVKQRKEWGRFLMSQYSDLKIQVEIARYGFLASIAKEDILRHTHEFFRDSFYLPIEQAVNSIRSGVKQIDEMKENSAVVKKLESLREDLLKEMDEKVLEPMRDTDRIMAPVRHIENVLSDLQADSSQFSDELNLARKRESSYPVPHVEMDTIRWQSLAARFMNEEAVKKLDPSLQQFDKLLSDVISTAEEAVQIVDVNLLAATESTLKENAPDDDEGKIQTPLSISLEGLQRAISSLEKAIKEIREKHNVYKEIAEMRLPTALDTLAGTMLRRDFDRFELQDKAFIVKEQALDWKQKISAKLAHASEKIELGWRFSVLKFDQYSRVVKPYLGIQEDVAISTKEKRNLAEYLARPSVPGDLPFVYKRLFNRDFSIDNRFYISPANSFKMIGDSYDQWSRGISSNVAVIGEKGSGKSTLIRFAEQQYLMDESIARVNLNETFTKEEELLKKLCDALGFKPVSSKDEFIEKVERKKKRSVIIVENIQNMFIRNINGFEALEAFWVILSSTMDKLFWIVSCSRYSWEFFIKITEADQYFSHVAYTDRLDEAEIREAILTRHKSSGYELHFEPDESLKNSRAFKKLLGDEKKSQELVRDQFFSKLSKICEGNTSIAMIFWLQSIKEITDRRFIFQPLEVTDIDKLEAPSKEVLFTLAALVQHDMMSREQVALALHQSVAESSLMLARLKTKGIIYAGSSGFTLNHLVYRQVIRMLKQRNIIY
jgi:hypothetical protein